MVVASPHVPRATGLVDFPLHTMGLTVKKLTVKPSSSPPPPSSLSQLISIPLSLACRSLAPQFSLSQPFPGAQPLFPVLLLPLSHHSQLLPLSLTFCKFHLSLCLWRSLQISLPVSFSLPRSLRVLQSPCYSAVNCSCGAQRRLENGDEEQMKVTVWKERGRQMLRENNRLF